MEARESIYSDKIVVHFFLPLHCNLYENEITEHTLTSDFENLPISAFDFCTARNEAAGMKNTV